MEINKKKNSDCIAEEIQKKIEQAFKDYQKQQKEKNIREKGCQLANILYNENKTLEKYIELQKKEINILAKNLVESRKSNKWETILAWTFVSWMIGMFGMCLISTVYIIYK